MVPPVFARNGRSRMPLPEGGGNQIGGRPSMPTGGMELRDSTFGTTLPGRDDRVQVGSPPFHNGSELRVRTTVNTRGQPRTASTATTIATSERCFLAGLL